MQDISLKIWSIDSKTIKFLLNRKWTIYLLFALVGAHFLNIYREPIHTTTILWDGEYLLWLGAWTVLLVLLQWITVCAVQFLFFAPLPKVQRRYVFRIKTILFFSMFLCIVPFVVAQVTAVAFRMFGMAEQHPDYLDKELSVLNTWIFAYACFLVFSHNYRVCRRKERQRFIAARIIADHERTIFELLHPEDISSTFMIIRKGDTGFTLNNRGSFHKDHRRAKEIRKILEFGYVEVSKGIYINKKDIERLDEENNKVQLSTDSMELLYRMLDKYPKLNDIHHAIRSEHGLLYLSPNMMRKMASVNRP